MTNANSVTEIVGPMWLRIAERTGSLFATEVPKSPCRISAIQFTYCTGSGSYRPMAFRKDSTCSSLASGPSILCAGSPGVKWIIENTITDIISRTGIVDRILLTKYRSIDILPFAALIETSKEMPHP